MPTEHDGLFAIMSGERGHDGASDASLRGTSCLPPLSTGIRIAKEPGRQRFKALLRDIAGARPVVFAKGGIGNDLGTRGIGNGPGKIQCLAFGAGKQPLDAGELGVRGKGAGALPSLL